MPLSEAPGDGLGLCRPSVVKRNAVEVVLDLHFVGVVGADAGFCPPVGIFCFGAGKTMYFHPGPHSVGLHIARIIGAREAAPCGRSRDRTRQECRGSDKKPGGNCSP